MMPRRGRPASLAVGVAVVGNVGDARINNHPAGHGHFIRTLRAASGDCPAHTLHFTADIDENGGLFGTLTPID